MAPRRPTPEKPQRPNLSKSELEKGIAKIERRIGELEAFDPSKVTKRFNIPEVSALENAIDEALSYAFGHGTVEYRRYDRATSLDHGGVEMGGNPFADYFDPDNAADGRRYIQEGKEEALALLRQAVKSLREEIDDLNVETDNESQRSNIVKNTRDVFVVHGRDDGPKETVARFLEKIGFNPIILHERPNKGRPLITKLADEAASAGFAVIIITPDDVGCLEAEAPGNLKKRARQNVVFELGYFIGNLGPERVAAMMTDSSIEKPTDYDGVAYIHFDGTWKSDLAKELDALGYEIDWNKVMRS